MAFEAPLEAYNGKIKEVTIGKEDSAVTVGGETALSFYTWEGKIPHKCAIAMEVFDVAPEGWPVAVVEPFKDVINDPIAWAVKCEKEYDAEMICLQLAGTDPNGLDKSPDEAASLVKAVLDKVSVPVIVYGSGNVGKDAEVMKKVAQVCEGANLLIGPAIEDNYKQIAAAALGYNHNVVAQTPIDVNMAKQLNILITQLGLDASKIVIDPSTGALGYGIEYTYSVMERLRLAALQQNDEMTQVPLICNLGKEVWRTKEARVSEEEEPRWGDAAKRGILWEAVTAVSLMISGADILIMRHPEAVNVVKKMRDKLLS